MFKKIDNRDFLLVQNLTIGRADFNQFMRFMNQLGVTAETIGRQKNLSPVLIPTTSNDMDEQLKQAPKLVDVVNRSCRKTCVTLLQYNVDKPEMSNAQVQLNARKNEDEKFQHIVFVKNELEEAIYLVDVMNSVVDKGIINKTVCIVQ